MSKSDYPFTRTAGAPLPVPNPNAIKKNKKELEEIRKREEEVAAATAYEEFVASFDEPAKHGKTFVRGTTFNAGTREERSSRETGKLYRPTSKIAEAVMSRRGESPPNNDDDRYRNDKARRKEKDKRKSNLELFKEELKIIQEEREERHKLKTGVKEIIHKPVSKSPEDPFAMFPGGGRGQGVPFDDMKMIPQFNLEDQSTTNIYLGNVNPKMTEQQLCETFGRYGPLASIKIMWPRSDEEKARGRNCGFVAFMNRKDGERAMKALNGREIMMYEMKLGWGKAVPIPPQPVYIPPLLLERTLPPPPSGLPFNGQPSRRDKHKLSPGEQYILTDENEEEFKQILANAVVKVVVPTERNLLSLIHRMIEFVVREGPMFEAMIMNREISNPVFRFLFENQSPAHVYYRWKLYSILHGDSPSRWRTTDFRMFKIASIWRPPPINPYTQGMPEDLVEKEEIETIKKGQLSNSQRDRFEDMLRIITLERGKIADTMIYCIEHAEAAEEVCECIAESLSILHTPLTKKIARLYLISDILHNCSAKVANVSYYRKGFQSKLPQIFKDFQEAYKVIEGRLKAEQFKQKVMGCFRSWEEWTIYPSDFLIRLQNIFLGLVPVEEVPEENSKQEEDPQTPPDPLRGLTSYDGAPLDDDEEEGSDREGPTAETPPRIIPPADEDDLDGLPIGDDLDGMPLEEPRETKVDAPKVKFAPSKWETVDPTVIEAQAMTTSKWDLLDQQEEEASRKHDHDDSNTQETDEADLDGRPMEEGSQGDNGEVENEREREARENLEFFKTEMSEERRSKLREIELKVMKCQDELEMGKRSRKSGMTIAQQVSYYRHKLMKKERLKLEQKDAEREKQQRRDRRDSSSPDNRGRGKDRGRHRGSTTSTPSSRGRSRSPSSHKKLRSTASKRERSRSPVYRAHAGSPPTPPRSSSKSHKSKKSKH